MDGCHDFAGLLGAEVYGDLSDSERERLKGHLAGCAACRAELAELRKVAGLVGRSEPDLSPTELDGLVAGVTRKLRPTRTRRTYVPRRRWASPLIAAASVAAAVLLVIFAFNRQEPVQPDPTPPPVVAKKVDPIPDPVLPTPKPTPPQEPAPKPQPKPSVVPEPPPKPRPQPTIPPEPTPKTPPAPTPPVEPAPKPQPKRTVPPKPAPRRTVVVVGSLERVVGDVTLVKPDGAVAPKAGTEVASGNTIRTTGRRSLAILRYRDGTTVEIGPDTELFEGSEAGKMLRLERGTIRAVVARQPVKHPMIVRAHEAEARVLGTTFLMAARPDAARLEVREGRVRFLHGGRSVLVSGGHAAVAAENLPLEAKPARISLGLLALYTFRDRGGRILDDSGAGLPLDLRIRNRGAADWTDEGLVIRPRPRITSETPATKIIDACRASREVTLEAWVAPARAALPFDGAIVALSRDNPERNLTLIQARDRYEASLRTSTTNGGGQPALRTEPGTSTATLTHVVFVHAASGIEKIYLDGRERASGRRTGTFETWDPAFTLILGDEATEERAWSGRYRLVAVYGRALSPKEIVHNFRRGVE